MKPMTEAHRVLVARAEELAGAPPPSIFDVVTLRSAAPASLGFERWLCLRLARKLSGAQKARGGPPGQRASLARKGGLRW